MTIADVDRLVAEYAKTNPPLITVKQAAVIAHVPKGTVHDWPSRGVLDKFKTRRGRHLLLDRDGFVRWLAHDADR